MLTQSEKDRIADDTIKNLCNQASKLGKIIMEYRALFGSLYSLIHKPVTMVTPDRISRIEVMQIDKEEYERWQKAKTIIRDAWNKN